MRTTSLVKHLTFSLAVVLCLGFMLAQPTRGSRTLAPIRVMTFNIRVGTAPDGGDRWENRKDLVIEVIRKDHPDLLGLQEALRFQIDAILGALPEYAEIGRGRDDGETAGEYSPILYRQARFQVQARDTFWFSDTPTVPGSMTWGNHYPRICTWARFTATGSDFDFYYYNLHLDHQSQNSRVKSAALLSRRIRERHPALPVIVTGDFNAGEDNPAIRFLRGQVTELDGEKSPNLVDTFRRRHPDADSVGTFNGFKGERNGPKIDFIFVSKSFEVLGAEIDRESRDGRYPSDHFPVTATIR
jgi:endonuclease/exonuclease/phosphatase family metal-dependent hydrolase